MQVEPSLPTSVVQQPAAAIATHRPTETRRVFIIEESPTSFSYHIDLAAYDQASPEQFDRELQEMFGELN